MSYSVGHRNDLDLALLWLWYRLAATAPTWLLAWELPYAIGVALKRQKEKRKEKKGKKKKRSLQTINAGEDVEKREPSFTVGGNVRMENGMDIPQKTEYITIQQSHSWASIQRKP